MTKKTKTAKKKAPSSASKKKAVKAAKATSRMGATTAAILGQPLNAAKKKPMIGKAAVKPEWEKYQQILLDLRERLLQQMDGLAKESAEQMAGYSLHMADSGTDNFDRDFALSLLSSDQDAVYEIEEALKRIERNTYGVCELTGKVIPKARLNAIPWTRFTVEAQMKLEREGALRQRRLGALGTIDSAGSSAVEVDDDYEPEDTKRTAAKDKES